MKNTIVTALAVLASTAAFAGDLPSKTATPVPPVRPAFTQVEITQNGYMGLNAGATSGDNRATTGGLVIGANASQFLAVEGTYDYVRPNESNGNRDTKNQISVNVLPKYRILNTPVSVYGLIGAGYSWNDASRNGYTYTYGGGAKYDVTKSIEVDARYRRVEFFSANAGPVKPEDRFTFGVNYKF